MSRTVWGLWALDLVRKELRTRVQVPVLLHGVCGVEEQGHGHSLGLGVAAWLRVGLPGTSCCYPCSLAAPGAEDKGSGRTPRMGGQGRGGAGLGERAGPWLCLRARQLSGRVFAMGSVGFGTTCWAASFCLGLPSVERPQSAFCFPSKHVRSSGLSPVTLQSRPAAPCSQALIVPSLACWVSGGPGLASLLGQWGWGGWMGGPRGVPGGDLPRPCAPLHGRTWLPPPSLAEPLCGVCTAPPPWGGCLGGCSTDSGSGRAPPSTLQVSGTCCLLCFCVCHFCALLPEGRWTWVLGAPRLRCFGS